MYESFQILMLKLSAADFKTHSRRSYIWALVFVNLVLIVQVHTEYIFLLLPGNVLVRLSVLLPS